MENQEKIVSPFLLLYVEPIDNVVTNINGESGDDSTYNGVTTKTNPDYSSD